MPSNDLLHRFIFDDCDIRGETVTLGDSYREVLQHNPHAPSVQSLLGEFLAAAALLSSTLKFEGMIILQARGNGAISTIMAECNHHNSLRGIVRMNPGVTLADDLSLAGSMQQLLGEGVLVITIEPEKGERYQGIVPMESENLAGCLEHYFQQSEQLKTRLWFTANESHCSGFLLQALPKQLKTNLEENEHHWETLCALAETVTAEELLTLEHPELLYRLFHEEALRLFEPSKLHFACSCSRERTASALLSLGKDEVEKILIEDGHIDVDCQFCNQHYHFDAEAIRELLGGSTLH